MDDFRGLEVAGEALAQRLSVIGEEQLGQPSACPGWSVYDLVNHVNGGGHRYLLLMQGADAEELAGTRTQDHVTPDPLAMFRRWQRPLVTAFGEPGALERTVHHPGGDRPGLDLLRMRTLDLTLHAWDLARSLDLDETLDASLCSFLTSHCAYLVEELRGHGLYGPASTDEATLGVCPQQALLAQAGRA